MDLKNVGVNCFLCLLLLLCSCSKSKKYEEKILDTLPFRVEKTDKKPGYDESGMWCQEFVLKEKLGSKKDIEQLLKSNGFSGYVNDEEIVGYEAKGVTFTILRNPDEGKPQIVAVRYFTDE